ncbi:hypothetical protein [Cellvibrio sp. PSBB006]|uniref:hypothetical protein n=1 Tax=Cellvibrio sp. PSBB006 TaxID=1987723 RepID=UPI0018E01C9A|nr:hypothetical protein [Cellvibrio sp. PSBB006]
MEITNPVVEAQMLIRRPVSDCFEAFVNPEITTKFWFKKAVVALRLAKKYAGIGKCSALVIRSRLKNLKKIAGY